MIFPFHQLTGLLNTWKSFVLVISKSMSIVSIFLLALTTLRKHESKSNNQVHQSK